MVCSSSHRVATATASATARAAASSWTSLPSTVITCRRATSVARSREPVGRLLGRHEGAELGPHRGLRRGVGRVDAHALHHLGELGVVGGLAEHLLQHRAEVGGVHAAEVGQPGEALARTRRRNRRRSRQGRAAAGEPPPGRFRGSPKGDSPRPGPRRRSPGGRRCALLVGAVLLVAAVAGRSPGTSPAPRRPCRRCGCRHRVHGRRPCLLIPTRTDLVPAVWPYIKTTTDRRRLVPARVACPTGTAGDTRARPSAAYDCGRDGHPCRDP